MFDKIGKAKIKTITRARTSADGKTPVLYRVTIERKSKYYKTGINVLPKEFDNVTGNLNSKAIAYRTTNQVLNEKCVQFEALVANGQIQNFYDAEEFFNGVKSSLLFSDYAKTYLGKSNLNSDLYNKQFGIAVRDFNEFAEGIAIGAINNAKLQEYIEFLRSKKLKENTISNKLKFVKVLLNSAMQEEVIPTFKIATKITSAPENIKFLIWSEVEKIEAIIYNENINPTIRRCALWFCFVCETGLRYGDLEKTIRNIQAGVDFENEIYHTTQKTDAVNPIPLTANAKKYIALMRTEPFNVQLYANSKYNEYLKSIQLVCGINTTISTHVARHTCATNMLNNGIALEVVQAMLGHASRRMTEKYAKIVNSTLRNAIAELDRRRSEN
jgi:site-specific recombinase XerD